MCIFMAEKNGKPARIWIATTPRQSCELAYFEQFFSKEQCKYVRGQLERGESGFEHWQWIAWFSKPIRLSGCRKAGPDGTHWEPTRSSAAVAYVWKESTSLGLRFEHGSLPKEAAPIDWDNIKDCAKGGKLDDIPSHVFVRCYQSLCRISRDYMAPVGIERTISVYWGRTGVGKSRRAWDEAGLQAYPKDPRTKFWDGYRGQEHVVIDEFRGDIDVAHLLRWFDRYPVIVEIKGSSAVLSAKKIWITSNLGPGSWFPTLDTATFDALQRRFTEVIEMK